MVRKIKGYTTLELLIILALIGILAGLFVREFLIYTARERLKGASEELAADLNFTKTRSMISLNVYGFCYDNDTQTLIIFEDSDKSGNYTQSIDTVHKRNNLMENWKGVQIENITYNRTFCAQGGLVFDRRGSLLSGGAAGVSFILKNSFGEISNVTVNSLGRISITYGAL